MKPRQLLVTGFGPFDDVAFNPSGAIAHALSESPPGGWEVTHAQLPVTFEGAPLAVDDALSSMSVRPDLMLGLGVHRGRSFRLERRARLDGDERVTKFDVRQQALALANAGAGAVMISSDAGKYVCERAYHHQLLRSTELQTRALFLHVPPEHTMPHAEQTAIIRAWLAAWSGAR